MSLQEPDKVAFDEAGNTGPNLLDRDQPVFVLASVRTTDEIASIAETGQTELKFSRLRNSLAGRFEILRVLNHPALTAEAVMLSGFHKRFLAVTKIVDLLYEPMARAGGIDLYERGANLAMANLLYVTGPTSVGAENFDQLLATFVEMVRDRTDATIDAFYDVVGAAYRAASPDGLKSELGALLASRPLAEGSGESLHPGTLDPAIPAFVHHASEWTGRIGAPFEIVHDASKPLVNNQLVLEAMMSPAEVPKVIGRDRRKMNFPISATGIRFGDSEESPALQVADVIASSASYVLRAHLAEREDAFVNELLGTQVLRGDWEPVWPSAGVTPEDLDTTDSRPVVDPNLQVGTYVKERLGRIPPPGQRRKPPESRD